jgi:hypothetical protein
MVARLILLVAFLQAALAQEPGARVLTEAELKTLLSRTLTARFMTGRSKGIVVLSQDGTARVDGGDFTAKGTWRIKGDRYCSQYPNIRRGYENCYSVEKTGGNTYTLRDESGINSSWVVEK